MKAKEKNALNLLSSYWWLSKSKHTIEYQGIVVQLHHDPKPIRASGIRHPVLYYNQVQNVHRSSITATSLKWQSSWPLFGCNLLWGKTRPHLHGIQAFGKILRVIMVIVIGEESMGRKRGRIYSSLGDWETWFFSSTWVCLV